MGLAFTVDTPIKVARYGISSVVSIVDDLLIEKMRAYYSEWAGEKYEPITGKESDSRARRITAYLNLVKDIVDKQVRDLLQSSFEKGSDIVRYFRLLPESSPLKTLYNAMTTTSDPEQKESLCRKLRAAIQPGTIDVNIMAKVDRARFAADNTPLPPEFSDALAALRGFAQSSLNSAVVLSAGMNPRLYTYMEQFPDFYPDSSGQLRKKIILKVSDYRSAAIQGKMLAKKGLWVSEFRIESGLNCGGHAFATEGLLLGPILEQFKTCRTALYEELLSLYTAALAARGIEQPPMPCPRISVQGGIGTAEEHSFLLEHYNIDAAGWGSPFLLVPEATSVDEKTLQLLSTAPRSDYYTSNVSPFGIPFNTVRGTSSEQQKQQRIDAGRPGSPCIKKHLAANTEFTAQPICVGSRQYQALKIKQLQQQELTPEEYQRQYNAIVEKDCLCEGLSASAMINTGQSTPSRSAVLVCPGPNLGYFSGVHKLDAMIGHIYGRERLSFSEERPHIFVNELNLYIDYLEKKVADYALAPSASQQKYIESFRDNLFLGIQYYRELAANTATASCFTPSFLPELQAAEQRLQNILLANGSSNTQPM